MDIKSIIALVGSVLAVISYIPYFRGIFKGETKPHAVSWFIWALIPGIVFAIQLTKEAGAGAWITGVEASLCLLVFLAALFYGEKRITRGGIVALIVALAAIPLWIVTENPLYSVLLVCVIDIVGFYPTFRKSWNKPHEEVALTYFFNAFNYGLSIVALTSFAFVNWFYAAVMAALCGALFVFLLIRRRAVSADHF